MSVCPRILCAHAAFSFSLVILEQTLEERFCTVLHYFELSFVCVFNINCHYTIKDYRRSSEL